MRKKIVAGNWKMNGRIASIEQLLQDLSLHGQADTADMIVIPPAIYLPLVAEFLRGKHIKCGAQNVYPASEGAFTGEISAPMLQEFHCEYVLVGHSERRRIFFEDEKFIADKFHHVKEHGMIPILCVGETLEDREKGLTKDVLAGQLQCVAERNPYAFHKTVIAYEPVWAIGTGQTASLTQIQETHCIIRSLITEFGEEPGYKVSLLYGGSVNEHNAAAIFAMPDVDGGLIGGASLNAQKFLEIVSCIN